MIASESPWLRMSPYVLADVCVTQRASGNCKPIVLTVGRSERYVAPALTSGAVLLETSAADWCSASTYSVVSIQRTRATPQPLARTEAAVSAAIETAYIFFIAASAPATR